MPSISWRREGNNGLTSSCSIMTSTCWPPPSSRRAHKGATRFRLSGALAILTVLVLGAWDGDGQQVPVLLSFMRSETAGQVERPSTIPLSTYTGLLRSMTVTVAAAAHPFIFDTGGGETMITPEVASAIGCKPYGRAIGFRMGGERVTFEYCDDVLLRLGDVAIAHDRVGVFDLKSVLPAGVPPADGVVSLRSFRDHPVTIELAMERITLETASSLAVRTRGMRPLTIRVGSGPTGAETAVYIAARAGGRLVWLLLDSGNGDRALVAAHVAGMAGLNDSEGEAVVEFDGLGAIRLPMRTRNIIYDGVLGAAFMRDWIFTLDLASNRAWATPAARPKQ